MQAAEYAVAASRRRERRLRQWLRYKRMTVAMALSDAYHHTMSEPALLKKGLRGTRVGAERARTHLFDTHGRKVQEKANCMAKLVQEVKRPQCVSGHEQWRDVLRQLCRRMTSQTRKYDEYIQIRRKLFSNGRYQHVVGGPSRAGRWSCGTMFQRFWEEARCGGLDCFFHCSKRSISECWLLRF